MKYFLYSATQTLPIVSTNYHFEPKESGRNIYISYEERTTHPQVGVFSINLLLRIEFLN